MVVRGGGGGSHGLRSGGRAADGSPGRLARRRGHRDCV
ncbi:hypothetical protein SBD_8158 [Streptomyces bottropensis ATCC 25435]|uniref:Uncharacterized protein n=1 Tax=Streptomyces bottropensis ATCC 25435 TaxID=1054862 RepID=M3FCQ3_9ACTN|nr:hypothetical protein SBD_8158 [Streptomyces bottropensis ATCC 25435]